MRNASSTGALRSSSPSDAAPPSRPTKCACSEQYDDARRAQRRAPRRARRASRSTRCPRCARASPRGRPSSCASQSQRQQLELGRRGRGEPERSRSTFSAAVSSSARMPGSEPVFAKYAKKRGWFQCVIPGRRIVVEVAQHVRERLGLLGRRGRQARADLAGLRPARARAARRRARGSRRPSPRPRGEIVAEACSVAASAASRSASRCACSRRRPSSATRGAPGRRRARRSRVRAIWWPSESITSLTPASRAARACTSRQVEPVGLRVDLEERPRLERLLDHALEVDVRRRALADLPARQVADAVDVRALHRGEHALGRVRCRSASAPTRRPSRAPARSSSATSSSPFARMFTSIPVQDP